MSALNLTASLPAGSGCCLPMPHRPDTGGATREDARCEPNVSLSHCRTVSPRGLPAVASCTIGRDGRTLGPRETSGDLGRPRGTSEDLGRFYGSLIPRERSRQRVTDLRLVVTRCHSWLLCQPVPPSPKAALGTGGRPVPGSKDRPLRYTALHCEVRHSMQSRAGLPVKGLREDSPRIATRCAGL